MSAKLSRCSSIPPPPSNCSILAEALKNYQILNLQLLYEENVLGIKEKQQS
jgi:hypothetical protein